MTDTKITYVVGYFDAYKSQLNFIHEHVFDNLEHAVAYVKRHDLATMKEHYQQLWIIVEHD